jgi:integrase
MTIPSNAPSHRTGRWFGSRCDEGKVQRLKTQKSRRIDSAYVCAIASLKASRSIDAQESRRSAFPNKSGEPSANRRCWSACYNWRRKRAGLGRVTWHQFRHIHSSLLNDLRVPVKIAQEQLGHASISTTLNIYTHVVDASHRQAIEALERQLFPTVPKSQNSDTPSDALSVTKRAG